MTEREKMLSGQFYCADEPDLNAARTGPTCYAASSMLFL